MFEKETEYMDYTLLKKKGLLKAKEDNILKSVKTDGGFIDFTSMRNEPSADLGDSSSTTTTEANTSNFGFLADMASPVVSSGTNLSPPASFDFLSNNSPISSTSGLNGSGDSNNFNALKIKVDDLNYKIDRFIERVDKLEEKLARFG